MATLQAGPPPSFPALGSTSLACRTLQVQGTSAGYAPQARPG